VPHLLDRLKEVGRERARLLTRRDSFERVLSRFSARLLPLAPL